MTIGDAASATETSPRSWVDTLRACLDPRLIAVLFMGFSSGLPLALSGGTLQVWQARAGVDLGVIGFFVLVGVAYSLKFLWAPFMDRIALPWPFRLLGRRRGWAILSQLGLIAAILLLGSTDPATQPAMTALCAVFVAFCSASQDIVIDAYRIELLEDRQQGIGAAMTQIGYRFGMIASGAGALWLHSDGDGLSWSAVYAVMALLVLIGSVTVLLTREPVDPRVGKAGTGSVETRGWYALVLAAIAACGAAAFLLVRYTILGGIEFSAWFKWVPPLTAIVMAAIVPVVIVLLLPRPRPDARRYAELHDWIQVSIVAPFRDLARHQGWLPILIFIVLYKFGDAFAGSIANAFYVKLEFTDVEIAWVSKTFGPIMTLVGVALGGLLVVRIGLLQSLLVGGIVQMLSNLMFAWQAYVGHDIYALMLTIALENLSGGIGSAAFVAYLSRLCNVTFTGTQYALLSSLAAVARTVLSAPGGEIAKLIGWYDYFILSTFMALPGLILLIWMMRRYPPPSVTRTT